MRQSVSQQNDTQNNDICQIGLVTALLPQITFVLLLNVVLVYVKC